MCETLAVESQVAKSDGAGSLAPFGTSVRRSGPLHFITFVGMTVLAPATALTPALFAAKKDLATDHDNTRKRGVKSS